MRNLKKILALALVFAMTFAFTASAASFTDQAEIGANYVDDVNMLVELGVIAGYPDGSFGPAKNITRAEFAKMAYTLKYGSDADGDLFAAQTSKFTDVQGNANVAWAKGYINYCANQNIVSGVGNNKFNPSGNITVAEATKMILVILGCDPTKEGFVGANWMANVTAKAIDLGVYDGWAGDPSQLATRELVAKLMRNAIFSPVYEYSAISGLGSQMDALGQNWNMTLGEKTMGLFHIEGIVVANERHALETNEEGKTFADDGDDVKANRVPAPTNDDEKSSVYYVTKTTLGVEQHNIIDIDRGLADEFIGSLVDVYYTADVERDRDGNVIAQRNVEVIGNVLVNSKTVAYDADSLAVDVYPNGKIDSNTKVQPYIAFETEDGNTVQILADREVLKSYAQTLDCTKVEKKVDVQDVLTFPTAAGIVSEAFEKYAYTFVTSANDEDASTTYEATAVTGDLNTDSTFLADMGVPTLSKYRFISVDGGKTFAYMIKLADDNNSSAVYGSVTNYSETKGVITLTGGAGSVDLDDCVINGEIAIDDAVVYYRESGKLVVNKVDVITGALEDYADDNGVVIGGNTYYQWAGLQLDGDDGKFFGYYNEYPHAKSNATYYVYNGMIMEIDADDVAGATESSYAVILKSEYDEKLDAAYVKLAFADNTEGTYEVSKTRLKNAKKPNDAANAGNRGQDFAQNAYFGLVVKYTIKDNGTVDLSAQDLADSDYDANYIRGAQAISARVDDGKVTFNGTEHHAYNDNSVLFVLYGNPFYGTDGEVHADGDTDGNKQTVEIQGEYAPVRARAYKINEVGTAIVDAMPNAFAAATDAPADTQTIDYAAPKSPLAGDIYAASIAFSSSKATNKFVTAMAITQDETGPNVTGANESNYIAYIVSATQKYNAATSEYYAVFNVISEEGVQTLTTVEDVPGLTTAQGPLPSNYIGSLSKENADFYAGGFIRYDLNAEGKISALDVDNIRKGDIGDGTVTTDGTLQLVNIANRRGNIVSYYPTDAGYNPQSGSGLKSAMFDDEDPTYIIGIDDGDFIGETITTLSARDTVNTTANKGNAIIEFCANGKIRRVFSFIDGWSR